MEQRSVSRETLAAQALGEADPVSGGLAPVISPATNYERQLDGSYRQDRVYTRADNPTSELAERVLAALEGTGCACAVFASGMAAATAVFQSLLPGDHVLVSRVLYWGVRKWLAEFALTWGLDVEFADTTDLGAVAAAIRPGQTRLLWVETPANPMWEVTDLAAVCALAHAAGVRVAVDNTVATPVLTRPVVAADTPMLILAAVVAGRMGLPHNPVDAVMAASDKAVQRRRWAAAQVAQPAFRVVLTAGALSVTAVFDKPWTPKAPPSRKRCSSPPPGFPNRCSPRPSPPPGRPPAPSASPTAPSTPSCASTNAAARPGRSCSSWRPAASAACAHAGCGFLAAPAWRS